MLSNNILVISEFSNKQARCKSCRSEIALDKYHENVIFIYILNGRRNCPRLYAAL